LREELFRLRSLVHEIVQAAVSRDSVAPSVVEARSAALLTLGEGIASFVAKVRTGTMPLDVGDDLARALRTGRYLHEAARLALQARALHDQTKRLARTPMRARLEQALADAADCVELAGRTESESEIDTDRSAALDRFEGTYQKAKAASLAAVVDGRCGVEMIGKLLDDLSATRRMVEQLVKADRLLRSPDRANAIEQAESAVTPPENLTERQTQKSNL